MKLKQRAASRVPPFPRIAERTDDDLTLLLATLVELMSYAVATSIQPTNYYLGRHLDSGAWR